jgi:hypothetical protein
MGAPYYLYWTVGAFDCLLADLSGKLLAAHDNSPLRLRRTNSRFIAW